MSPAAAPAAQLLLLGCDHLTQLYKPDNPQTDMLTPQRQAELAAVRARLARFRPDALLVEVLPEKQGKIDSLYEAYRGGRLSLNALPDGRSEVYQVAFALGRELNVPRVYCVDAPGGTSQSILHEGKNIELYQQETARLREKAKAVGQRLQAGQLTLGQYLSFLNGAATVQQLHHLVYRTPARVTDGTLRPDPMVDAAFVSPKYVGAEFISVFYNRDLKVYSNVVTTQMATGSARLLLVMGARHIGSLQGIFRDDPAFRLVPAANYLPRN